MKDLEILHYELGGHKYEIKYHRMEGIGTLYFLLDDIFEVLKYENSDREKEYKESFEKFLNEKEVIYLKGIFSWIDNKGGLTVGRFASETLFPFVSLLTLLNLSEEAIENYVSSTRFRLLKQVLEEKFRKEKMIEELLEVPKDLNEVLPPIENYRPLDKTSDEIIKEGEKLINEKKGGK